MYSSMAKATSQAEAIKKIKHVAFTIVELPKFVGISLSQSDS